MTTTKHAPQERRRTLRRSLRFWLDIRHINDIALPCKWDDEQGMTLSTGGFSCIATRRLPEAAKIVCQILFEKREGFVLMDGVTAKCRWASQRKDKWWEHGFSFTALSPENRRKLEMVMATGYET